VFTRRAQAKSKQRLRMFSHSLSFVDSPRGIST
jgi:hypothetical protein